MNIIEIIIFIFFITTGYLILELIMRSIAYSTRKEFQWFITKDDELPKNILLSKNLSLVVKNADLIFVSTDHKIYSKLSKSKFKNAKKPLLIYDGRNILQKNFFDKVDLLTIGNYS